MKWSSADIEIEKQRPLETDQSGPDAYHPLVNDRPVHVRASSRRGEEEYEASSVFNAADG
jgi:hypothetical protein